MSLGRMTNFISIVKTRMERDKDNIMRPSDEILANVRAYIEFRHGTERWSNLAAFSTANCLFRFRRIPGLTVTPDMSVISGGVRYRIISAEDVRGRGMYIEVLASDTDPTIY